ncbi:MAG: MarR family winged helix-turn-helix transcriptional regulator [Pseudomonadales bacterium]
MSDNDLKLGDLVHMVGVELRIAQILADQAFSDIQHPKIASGHYTVLSLVNLNPGINQSALARCLYLDRSSMVPILDQLENKGWIERRKQVTDRRSHALHLTRKGRTVLKQLDQPVRNLEAQITKQMGKKNRDQLLALIQQFQSVLLTLQNSEQV